MPDSSGKDPTMVGRFAIPSRPPPTRLSLMPCSDRAHGAELNVDKFRQIPPRRRCPGGDPCRTAAGRVRRSVADRALKKCLLRPDPAGSLAQGSVLLRATESSRFDDVCWKGRCGSERVVRLTNARRGAGLVIPEQAALQNGVCTGVRFRQLPSGLFKRRYRSPAFLPCQAATRLHGVYAGRDKLSRSLDLPSEGGFRRQSGDRFPCSPSKCPYSHAQNSLFPRSGNFSRN